MKKNIIKTIGFTSASIVFMLIFSVSAHAHYPWINMSDFTPESGSALKMTIGWGHKFPLAGFLKKNELQNLKVTGPEKVNLKFVSNLEIESEESINTPGAYIISAVRKPGFYTKTARGGKRASKLHLKDVIKCYFSHMCMKAIINSGSGKGKVDTIIGQPMEIVPLKNPGSLHAGDYLPLRVLCQGKPFNGYIYATYAGFSTQKEVFAYTTKTDRNGRGQIRIFRPGIWLIKANQEKHYPDEKLCDVESFIATLTFEVD
jgi:uncharacterized GH25 family protein